MDKIKLWFLKRKLRQLDMDMTFFMIDYKDWNTQTEALEKDIAALELKINNKKKELK
jgi:hypothetical protein